MRENGILNNEDFFTSDELMEDWAPRQLTSSPPKSLGRVDLEALCLLNSNRIQDKLCGKQRG